MPNKSNLRLYFKEYIKTEPFLQGIDRIKPIHGQISPTKRRARKNLDYVCDLFVYEPRNVEEAQLGTLFMLGKIKNIPKNKYKNSDFLLNLLISVIKREFYSNPKRPTLAALESSLNKANLYLADFAEKGNTEWNGNLSFMCGAFSNNTLHIAQVGELIIKLFRGTSISHIEKKFPIRKKFHPLKTFDNIASGKILNKDKIIIGTKNILKIAPLKRLKEFSRGGCRQIIENIKKSAEDANIKDSIICLAVEAKVEEIEIPIRLGSNISVRSIENKIGQQTLTKKTSKYYQNKPIFFVTVSLIVLLLILPFFVVQKINYHIKTNNFNGLAAEIQETQKMTDLALVYQNKEKAKGLLQRNQVLLDGLLKYLGESPIKKNRDALDKAALLEKKHQEQQDSINNVKRITELEEILDFSKSNFSLSPVGLGKIENNLYFYELESGILYKVDLDFEKTETVNKEQELTLIFISSKDELRKMVILENGQIVLLGQSGRAYLYDNDNKTNKYDSYSLDPNIPLENIQGLGAFLTNFYILDGNQGNILKYSLSQLEKENETINGKNWLSEPQEELKNAKSLAIDGSIYVLKSDYSIAKYFKGQKIGDIKPILEKPLAGKNKIFTKVDFANLYISDSENKRLIVLNKKGEVINQYVNDEFIKLQDFWVTKDEKEIYLLCEKKVFRLEL